MRIIDVCGAAIRAAAVSADGRFVAASAVSGWFGLYHWATGDSLRSYPSGAACEQLAFAPDGRWVASVRKGSLWFEPAEGAAGSLDDPGAFASGLAVALSDPGPFAGGLAVSPDARRLVATHAGPAKQVRLVQWSLPRMNPEAGYAYWSPFRRLAFSPNGEFVAGIWPGAAGRFGWGAQAPEFELRFARSGGLDYHYPPMNARPFDATGFVGFTRDSHTCAFGWEDEFHVIDVSTGTSRYVRRVEASFIDAAFCGSGRLFATVDLDGRLRMWDAATWQVVREYDWGCGPLTCLAITADGSSGVCGTASGQLVQFDVDE